MERLYTHYTAEGRQIVLNNVPASFASITVENIRLIFNETQKDDKGDALDPLASTGAKERISSVVYNETAHTVTITLADTVPTITSGDDITIKLDMGEGVEDVIGSIEISLHDLDDIVAKEAQATLNKREVMGASNAQATNTQGLFFPAISFPNGAVTQLAPVYATQIEIEGVATDVTMIAPVSSNNCMFSTSLQVGTIISADDFAAAMEISQAPSQILPLLRLFTNADDIQVAGNVILGGQLMPIVYGRKYRVKEIVTHTVDDGTASEYTMSVYVYEELSEGKSIQDVYTVISALNNPTVAQIQSGLAKQGSDSTKSITSLDADLGDVAAALEYMEQGGMPQIAQIAKQGTNANATLTDTQAALIDGNDTAISVGKEIRSEVGTGSDTAAETGTLFAVVKWIKDRVNAITGYALQGNDNTATNTAIMSAIGYTIQEIDGV